MALPHSISACQFSYSTVVQFTAVSGIVYPLPNDVPKLVCCSGSSGFSMNAHELVAQPPGTRPPGSEASGSEVSAKNIYKMIKVNTLSSTSRRKPSQELAPPKNDTQLRHCSTLEGEMPGYLLTTLIPLTTPPPPPSLLRSG